MFVLKILTILLSEAATKPCVNLCQQYMHKIDRLILRNNLLLGVCSLYPESYETYRTQQMLGKMKSDEILTICKHPE